ncbi:MAG: hypothetical protein U0R19_39290 [Bryobacteraceae bacterium]
MLITDVPGNFADGTTLVTFLIDPQKEQGPEGFVRADSYSVNPQIGPLTWYRMGEVTLNKDAGGVKGRRCMLCVCAATSSLSLSSVVSFYRAPGDFGHLNSPFSDPNPRRLQQVWCTNRIPKGGADGTDLFLYPILANFDGNGEVLSGEEFMNPGNYFYTMCVRLNGTDRFFICDPEMEIEPGGGG